MKSELLLLAESYEKNPIIKSLVKILPYGSAVDTLISVQLSNMKSARTKAFFDALNSGKLTLSENIINSNDFLYSFYTTSNYISRTRTDEKVEKFANIILQLAAGNINYNEFEDYTSVLNELSEREFAILAIKERYEQRFLPAIGETEYTINGVAQNKLQVTMLYWSEFRDEVINTVGIDSDELNSMLIRIQRTGCYLVHQGFWMDTYTEEIGNTTPLFKKILKLVSTN